MTGDRRSWFVALAGASCALVLASGVLAAVAVGRDPAGTGDGRAQAAGDSLSEVADTTTSTWPFVPAPPTTAAPVTQPPVATTRRPAATTTTRPPAIRPSSTTTTTAPLVPRNKRSDYGAVLPPELVQLPYTPGQTSWAGVSNGVSYKVSIDKPARAGTPVEFDVELSSTVHPCCEMHLLYGDGYYGGPGSFDCNHLPTAPGTARFHASHVYNLDGLWLFWIQAMSACTNPPIQSILMATIEVHPGPSTAQGPTLPQVEIDRTPTGHDGDLSWAAIAGQASDPDGWITSFTVDWGDGSPPLSLPTKQTCQLSLSNWPWPDRLFISTGQAVHHYLRPGSYTIVVTAVTTGCDGRSTPQSGSDRLVWTVPSG